MKSLYPKSDRGDERRWSGKCCEGEVNGNENRSKRGSCGPRFLILAPLEFRMSEDKEGRGGGWKCVRGQGKCLQPPLSL